MAMATSPALRLAVPPCLRRRRRRALLHFLDYGTMHSVPEADLSVCTL
jgi:hypothetical protein